MAEQDRRKEGIHNIILSAELDRRFKEHDRRHADKLVKFKNDVETNLEKVVGALERMEALHADTAVNVRDMKTDVAALRDLGVVWSNYKGWRNTMGAMFGRPTWFLWGIAAAVIYAISHDWQWPRWFRGD